MFSFNRFSFVFLCHAVISINLSSTSFVSPRQDSMNDEMPLFGVNDGSLLSTFSGEQSTQLTPFPSSGDDGDTSLFLPDFPPVSTIPLDSPAYEDLLVAATNNNECISLSDQQFTIGKKIRRNEICPSAAQKKKAPTLETPPPGTGDFPGLNANPGRFTNDPVNDPFPRPFLHWVNTDFDFIYCPSGRWGFREYAVCDSGLESDRKFDRNEMIYILYNVSPCTFIFFISLFQRTDLLT